MTDSYHREVEASMVRKFLEDLALMCGESVVDKGMRLYLVSLNKKIVNNPYYE